MKVLAPHQKLKLLYRVEPGCLGPDGVDHIEAFCLFAGDRIALPYYADCVFVPRYDKRKPEVSYSLAGKLLAREQLETYLSYFGSDPSLLEESLEEQLALKIEEFAGR